MNIKNLKELYPYLKQYSDDIVPSLANGTTARNILDNSIGMGYISPSTIQKANSIAAKYDSLLSVPMTEAYGYVNPYFDKLDMLLNPINSPEVRDILPVHAGNKN